jgi:ATP-dependent DNA helicase RecQ
MTKKQILKKYFGYDSFFPLQAEIIDHLLALNDALVLMPTGGGKSVCFQIPALMFDGVTIVISPLISLMKDQVEALKANGIAAEFLNSSLSAKEEEIIIERSLKGTLKLLYISPERLSSAGFIELLGSLKVSMFAVDEAHCISFWGHDFRPEYKRLNILKKRYPNVPLIALTATADRVIRRDILSQLHIPETKTFVASFDRPNLSLAVWPGLKRMRQIADFLKLHRGEPGIIYCLSRKSTESVANNLRKSGYKAKHYHAGMDNDDRSKTQNEFIRDEIQIICATVAFGMGIDKSNVRWVIHYNMPKNIESFYQEIGRSGRDGLPADTILFYSYADVMMQAEMINETTSERRELLDAKLKRMKQYAEAESCRRRILLSYFNETITKDCGNCDVCKNPPQKFDGTIIAQKALSAIARTGEQITSTLLIDILRGSHNRQVIEKEYDKIKTWGAGRDIRWEEWSDYIFQILNLGYVDIAYDEGYTFKLNTLSHLVLKNKINVMLVKFRPYKSRDELVLSKETAKTVSADPGLFDRLKKLRKTIADRNNIPAYIVFSDKTLQAMTETMPTDKISMLEVSGVGQQKFATYGQIFIDEISGFISERAGKGNKVKENISADFI